MNKIFAYLCSQYRVAVMQSLSERPNNIRGLINQALSKKIEVNITTFGECKLPNIFLNIKTHKLLGFFSNLGPFGKLNNDNHFNHC